MIEVRKRENESSSGLIYRFTKRIQQSGVLREAKKRRFTHRAVNRLKRKLSAIHRETKKQETIRLKKLGLL